MHTIYHTDAFVLDVRMVSEADLVVVLFTELFGIVHARATGILKSGAKLRSHVQPWSFTRVDIVRGREVWRLTSARMIENPLFSDVTQYGKVYTQYLSALLRYYIGEEPHPELFLHARDLLDFYTQKDTEKILSKTLATLSLFKLFYYLGYIEHEDTDQYFLQPLSVLLLEKDIHTENIEKRVRNALKQTHL